MSSFTESVIEQAAIDWLKDLGYTYAFGPEIALDGESPECSDYCQEAFFPNLKRG
jgi:type I restriction enzyme, R subunit